LFGQPTAPPEELLDEELLEEELLEELLDEELLAHIPPVHGAVPMHLFPHAPQLAGSLYELTSHPSVATPLQSRNPGLQA
jgi:hypothetical protein